MRTRRIGCWTVWGWILIFAWLYFWRLPQPPAPAPVADVVIRAPANWHARLTCPVTLDLRDLSGRTRRVELAKGTVVWVQRELASNREVVVSEGPHNGEVGIVPAAILERNTWQPSE